MNARNLLYWGFLAIVVIFVFVVLPMLDKAATPTPAPHAGAYSVDTYPQYADKVVCYVLQDASRKPLAMSCLPLTDIASADIKWPDWRETTCTPELPCLPAQGWPTPEMTK